MSKAEAKVTVTKGKTKDVVTDPQVRKAFGGKDDDTVVSIKLPKEESDPVVLPGGTLDTMIKKHKAEKHPVVQPGSYLEAWVDKKGGETSPIPENSPPTDRQIQNAERILKAAGRGMERKAGGLFVDGVEQEPLDTNISVTNRTLESPKLPASVYLNALYNYRFDDRKFNLFMIDMQGQQTYYLVDQESHVDIHAPVLSNRFMHGSRLGGIGILVLINSSSTDDTVIGESVLVNADSEKNLLNSTSLVSVEEPRGTMDYPIPYLGSPDRYQSHPWEESGLVLPSTKRRQYYGDSQFKRAQVQDSSISRGIYRHCHITQSLVEGGGMASVEHTQLTNSNLTGTRVTLKGASLNHCTLRSESEMLIKYTVFAHMHMSAKAVYLVNKFCYLSLDTPAHKLYMVRATRREIDLGTSHYTMERIKIGADVEEVRKVVALALSVDEEGMPVAETSITRSFANYLTDSIMSRLKVIQLLDEAKQLVQSVGSSRGRGGWDDLYSV